MRGVDLHAPVHAPVHACVHVPVHASSLGAGTVACEAFLARERGVPVPLLVYRLRASDSLVFDMTDSASSTVPSIALSHLLLAQEGVPLGKTGESSASSATGAATSGDATGAAAQPRGLGIEIFLFGAIILFIIMTFLGGRREKKKYEAMLAAIKKNDSVRTVGGIIGSVVEVKPDVVVLKVDENSNTKITVARSKIEAVMKESTTA
jgi:preprotein translocase subunit YajC